MSKRLLAAGLLLFLVVHAGTAQADSVVLLHGIARTAKTMEPLQEQLEAAGYRVLNVDYPSRAHDVAALVEKVHGEIGAFLEKGGGRTHFVGYSLGGLLTRAYLAKHPPADPGRIVLLGVPNGGSAVADFLKDNFFYEAFYGPAGQELVTTVDADAYFGELAGEIGVIAGDRSIDPVSSFLIDGRDDGKVSIESANDVKAADTLTLHVTHTFMPRNDEVIYQTVHFLKNGRFDHAHVFRFSDFISLND